MSTIKGVVVVVVGVFVHGEQTVAKANRRLRSAEGGSFVVCRSEGKQSEDGLAERI